MGNPGRVSGSGKTVQANLDINLSGVGAAQPQLTQLIQGITDLQQHVETLQSMGGVGTAVAGDIQNLTLLSDNLKQVSLETERVTAAQNEQVKTQEKLNATRRAPSVGGFEVFSEEERQQQAVLRQLNKPIVDLGDATEQQRDQLLRQGGGVLNTIAPGLQDILGSLGLDKLKEKADGTTLSISGLTQELANNVRGIQEFLGFFAQIDDLVKTFEKYQRNIRLVQEYTEQTAEAQAKEARSAAENLAAKEGVAEQTKRIEEAETKAAASSAASLATKEASTIAEGENTVAKARNTAATAAEGQQATETAVQTGVLSSSLEFLGTQAREGAAAVAIGANNIGESAVAATTGTAALAASAAAALVPIIAMSALFYALEEGSKAATSPLKAYLDGLEEVDARQVDVVKAIREGGETQLALTRRGEEAKLEELQKQLAQQQELQAQFKQQVTVGGVTEEVLAILGVKKEDADEIVKQIGDFIDGFFAPLTLFSDGLADLKDKVLNSGFQAALDALGFDTDESEKKVEELNQQLQLVQGNLEVLNEEWARSLAITEDLIAANREAYEVEKQREQLLALNSTAQLNQQIRLNIQERQNLESWAEANAEVLSEAVDRSLAPFNTTQAGFLERLNQIIDQDLAGGTIQTMEEFFQLQSQGLIAIKDVFEQNPLTATLEETKKTLANANAAQPVEDVLALIGGLDPGAKLEDQQAVLDRVNDLLQSQIDGFSTTFTNFSDLSTFLNDYIATLAQQGSPDQQAALQGVQQQLNQFGVVLDATLQASVVTADESTKRVQEQQTDLNQRLDANTAAGVQLNDSLVRQVVTINEGIGKTEKELSTLASATTAQVDSQVATLQNQIQAREQALDQLRALHDSLDPRSAEALDLNTQIASIEVDLDGLIKQMEFWDGAVRDSAEQRKAEAEALALENKREDALDRLTDELTKNADALDKAQGELAAYNAELDKQAERQNTRDRFNADIAAAQAQEAEQARAQQVDKVRADAAKQEVESVERYQKTRIESFTQFNEQQGEKAERYQEQTLKAQEDFNLRRLRAQQDLDDKLLQAVENNDVRGFIQAQREAQKRFDREDEDNEKSISERAKARQKELDTDQKAFDKRIEQARLQFEEQARAQDEATQQRVQQIIDSGKVEVKVSQQLRDQLAEIEAAWREEDKQLQEQTRRDQLQDRIDGLREEGETLIDVQAFYQQEQIDLTRQMWEAITKMGFSAVEVLQLAGDQAASLQQNITASLSVGASAGNQGGILGKIKNMGFFAEGGIVREPTLAVLGEDPYRDDAVISYPKGQTFFDELGRMNGRLGDTMRPNQTSINVTIPGMVVGKFADENDLAGVENKVYNVVTRAVQQAIGAVS